MKAGPPSLGRFNFRELSRDATFESDGAARDISLPPPRWPVRLILFRRRSCLQSFHAELHQYKHQIEQFNQLTQKLIAVYQEDDTTRVKKMTETINQRYNNLNTRYVSIIVLFALS